MSNFDNIILNSSEINENLEMDSSFIQFVKNESWRLFIKKIDSTLENEVARLEVSLVFPSSIKRNVRLKEVIIDVIRNKLYNTKELIILQNENQIDDIIREIGDDNEINNIFEEYEYIGKSLGEWVEIVMFGHGFANKINRPDEDKIVFIDYLFTHNSSYNKLLKDVKSTHSNTVLIIGDPKTGKTYTTLYLLYKKFCKSNIDIYITKSSKSLENKIKRFPKNSKRELYIYRRSFWG